MLQTPEFSDEDILAARPAKFDVDVRRPYAFFVEPERSAAGIVEDVATIFLTNRECPFKCLMCDLWQHTTDTRVPAGAIPDQIDYALAQLPAAKHVKLYNSGNFFDAQAIPRDDYGKIADRVRSFESVVVENHPKLCTAECVRFRNLLGTDLEIALGLETVHPEVLPRLNKQMTLDDFSRAAQLLRENGIRIRTFILLKPPFLNEEEGVGWALRSIEFAFDRGVECCSVVPTRSGNGIMEQLEADGLFAPPKLSSLETVLEEGIRLGGGRVFVDLWDVERFFGCPRCGTQRAARLKTMNFEQRVLPPVTCRCGSGA